VNKLDTGFVPHRYQTEYMRRWRRFNLCICTRGFGKTVMAVNKLIHECLKSDVRNASFAYIAPQKGQGKDIVWPFFNQYLASLISAGFAKIRNQDMEILFPESGNSIKIYGTDDGNDTRMLGKTFRGVVVDEFDSIKLDSWDDVIRPTLRGSNSWWALLIGTIQPGGHLCEFADRFGDDPEWNVGTYKLSETWEDLPAYDYDQYQRIVKEYADRPNIFARNFECDPTAGTDDAVIPMNLITAARGIHISEEAYRRLPKILGVDVATGGGRDNSSLCKRHGLVIESIKEYDIDNMELADVVAREIVQWQPDAVFIDKGRGEGVISRLRQMNFRVVGVDFGGSAMRKDIYHNKRVEMYMGIKEWLENGGVLPDDQRLCQELAICKLKPSVTEKFLMESKDSIKERLGRSPDMGDSLALTFASPVRKVYQGARGKDSRVKTVASTGYNPLDDRSGYGFIR